MIDTQYTRVMTRYNRWMNGKIYDACAKLSDQQRKRDLGAFFKSIHGTLNHLLLTDGLWLKRFRGEALNFISLDEELYADFGALSAARRATDEEIEAFATNLSDTRLRENFTYRTTLAPQVDRTLPIAVVLMHMFNHQAHHRGQVTTLLMQMGIDPGVTDLPWMPGLDAILHG